MFDVAIIGAGPAGLSAAINAAARNKSVCVLGQKKETSWLYKAEEVNNHLGMPNMTGSGLLDAFHSHASKFPIEIKEGRAVQALLFDDHFMINFVNEIIEAKTIILATGVSKSKAVEGEAELLGKGVSYCATCDGMLYRNKTVVVYTEIAEGKKDAEFLAEICKEVYFINGIDGNINDSGDSGNSGRSGSRSDSRVYKEISGKITAVLGEARVTAVAVGDKEIECDGVFFVKATIPPDSFIAGLELESGAIKVNRMMETNIQGIYAAGDCTGWPLQLSKAIGEGLIAAQSCAKYLSNR